jgi:D-sedoheptulose 7-phosphate isomerase
LYYTNFEKTLMIEQYVTKNISEHQDVVSKLAALNHSICDAVQLLKATIETGGKIMLCGNGGSAADSQHIAAELVGRFSVNRKPIPGLALSTDTSAITAIANDFSYDDIFSRQVESIGKPGDCLIGISTSGNSINVIKAIESANCRGIKTIGLVGCKGGEIGNLVNLSIIVPSCATARIQEVHILIGHILCGALERELGFVGIQK